ncbi:hypothetical protein AVEN_185599-1 [Araneus ventricosus]|uniref:Uncharacterized protein n=1 Tax=Araneus ventricosus TaxID=182803 RepID=A0A4Y2VR75_ARAVE|nr:hypothetical protein AVEN_185599-1 [Araneus ventricosus]
MVSDSYIWVASLAATHLPNNGFGLGRLILFVCPILVATNQKSRSHVLGYAVLPGDSLPRDVDWMTICRPLLVWTCSLMSDCRTLTRFCWNHVTSHCYQRLSLLEQGL